ncbi:MAG: EamA family transporter [Mucinivorans sp.]
MTGRLKAHTAIITANLLFALNYSYSKSLIPFPMSSEALCLARIGSAAIIFALGAVLIIREKIERRDFWTLALASFFGIGGNQYIFLQGLSHTSPVDASIIATTGPMIVLLVSAILGRDHITPKKLIGILVGAMGAMTVILYGGIANFGSGHLTGNLLVFASAFSYACYLIVVKDLMRKYSPFTIVAWIFGLSAVVLTPLLWDDLSGVDFANFSLASWGALTFVVVGATWLAYVCVAASLKKLSPTTASIYSYSQPVIASIFAIIRGQDRLDFVKIAAALLVFTGVYIVTRSYKTPMA